MPTKTRKRKTKKKPTESEASDILDPFATILHTLAFAGVAIIIWRKTGTQFLSYLSQSSTSAYRFLIDDAYPFLTDAPLKLLAHVSALITRLF